MRETLSMQGLVAHIGDSVSASASATWILVGLGFVAIGLTLLHHRTKYQGHRGSRIVPLTATVGVILALSAVMLPSSRAGQDVGGALPDLISDPPRPAFLSEQVTASGGKLLLTFDGYVHNIGEGALDITGNPQEPNGMVQKVLDGDEWREVSRPTIRYETDDGHNHFHLIEVIEYVLWDQAQGSQTAVGSKIGFCLVDSEQLEPGFDAVYSEEKDNFCEEDNPSATSLRMGITPGWRDIYDATTTLQWVDVSDLAPGRYWIGAITDPNNEIVESNEDNNSLIFSDRPAIVPGWLPTSTATSTNGSAVTIAFEAEAFGTVAEPVFAIEQGPASGSLDVPAGAAVGSNVTYVPDPGFAGTDEIVFSVRDAASRYPSVAPTATVTIDVSAASEASAPIGDVTTPPALRAESTFFEMVSGEQFSSPLRAENADGSAGSLFGINLPPGIRVDAETSTLTGVATQAGIFESELIAIGDRSNPEATATTQPVSFIVTEGTDPGLLAQAPKSSPLQRELRERVGRPGLGYRYEASGLPPGLEVDESAPVVVGTPTEVGVYEVELRHFEPTAPDEVARVEAFTWVVRPAIAISFPL